MKKDVGQATSIASLVALAADEFLDQLGRGEVPDLADYARRYPHVASVLPQVLPTLEMMKSLGSSPDVTDTMLSEPATLGDFRLLREIGRGGMGVVYEAEQLALGRRVALKVLAASVGVDPKRLARFQIETQVAAALDHPHIVPIITVGHDRGLHYYAMQLIEGCCLSTILKQPRHALEGTSDQPTTDYSHIGAALLPREAARLARQAALALAHAHSLGILHRDIKPANLLVDVTGDLWVTDFGLAHFAGVSDLTQSGDLLGTVRYMSPEQAAGGRIVDARTDIYSLGASLYELLTARPPFDSPDRQELIRQIATIEPASPRRLEPAIPRDLETICLKAIAKEPERRYATAQEFADDLRRFLDNRPIKATRPGLVQQMARWSGRHRRATAVALGLLVVLTTACAGGMAILLKEQRHTRVALEKARQAQGRERQALKFTFAASDHITSQALALIASGNRAGDPEQSGDFYGKALDYYQEISARYADDPEMGVIAAAAGHRAGFIQMIKKDQGAEKALRRSIAIYERLLETMPASHEVSNGLALTYMDIALLMRGNGDHKGAIEFTEKLVILRTRMADQFPAAHDNLISLTYFQAELCDTYAETGQLERAHEMGRRLRATYPRAVESAPRDHRLRNILAWHLARRLDVLEDGRRAVELATTATRLAPENGAYWNTLGVAHYRDGDDRAAIAALERSMSLRSGGDSYDWIFLAMAHARLREPATAQTWFDRADAWMSAHASQNRELLGFRAEAEGVIRHARPDACGARVP